MDPKCHPLSGDDWQLTLTADSDLFIIFCLTIHKFCWASSTHFQSLASLILGSRCRVVANQNFMGWGSKASAVAWAYLGSGAEPQPQIEKFCDFYSKSSAQKHNPKRSFTPCQGTYLLLNPESARQPITRRPPSEVRAKQRTQTLFVQQRVTSCLIVNNKWSKKLQKKIKVSLVLHELLYVFCEKYYGYDSFAYTISAFQAGDTLGSNAVCTQPTLWR